MMGADESLRDDIRKFEQIGTHPASQRNAITEALNFPREHRRRAQGRAFPLSAPALVGSAAPLPGVKILNSDDPEQSCGIGFISVDGFEHRKLVKYLWAKHRIWTTSYDLAGEYQGLRITPNVYTTLEEIDTFVRAMTDLIKRGSIPS